MSDPQNENVEELKRENTELRAALRELEDKLVGKSPMCPIQWNKLPLKTSGKYFVSLGEGQVAELDFLIESDGKVWFRGQRKIGQNC